MRNELTRQQAAWTKALRMQGLHQHQIAALWDVNPRAVNHVLNYRAYTDVGPDGTHGLPWALLQTSKFDLIQLILKNETGRRSPSCD